MVAGQAVPSSDTDGSVESSPSVGSLGAEQPLPQPRSEIAAERSGALSRAEVHAGFAAALRAGMAATALRQRELATRVGVSPGRISQYLNYPDKLPARWDRIAELLGAAGAEVEEFSRSFGAFWPDHPATFEPEAAGTEYAATDSEEIAEPDAAERAPGEGDLAEDSGGEHAEGGVPSAGVQGSGAGALEAATMVDANAAATGLVLSTPIPAQAPEAPGAPATAAPAAPAASAGPAAAGASLEVATEFAVPAVPAVPGVPPRPEKQLLAPGSGRFPAPRPAPPDSLDTPAPNVVPDSGPASGRFPEPGQVHVEEDPTGPIPVPPPDQNPSPDQKPARQFLGIFRRPFAVVAGLLVVAVAGIVFAVAVVFPDDQRPTASVAPTAAEPTLLGVVEGAGAQGLTERTFPSRNPMHRTPDSIPDGTPVAIICGQVGDPVFNEKATGFSTTWLRLQNGSWVTSVFVRINATSVPSCTRGAALPLALTPR